MKQGKQGIYARYIKRILDVLLSGCALVVLSPVLLIVAVLVRTKLGSPVIFCQERPGKDEKIFKMYKFRSMTDARDENGELLPDEVRPRSPLHQPRRAAGAVEHLQGRYVHRRPPAAAGAGYGVHDA